MTWLIYEMSDDFDLIQQVFVYGAAPTEFSKKALM